MGKQWLDKWAVGKLNENGDDIGVANAKRVWASRLAGMTAPEIKDGIDADYAYPPSCDEFKIKCREPIKPEAAFYEAVEQMQRRSTHTDKWNHPAIYWAAATIGTHDLHYGTWASMGSRWTKIFNAQMAAGEWQPIPERLSALPPPIKSRSDENTAKFQAQVSSVLNPRRDHKKWARDHKANYMAGKPSLFCQYSIPAEALGETVEQWATERSAK